MKQIKASAVAIGDAVSINVSDCEVAGVTAYALNGEYTLQVDDIINFTDNNVILVTYRDKVIKPYNFKEKTFYKVSQDTLVKLH